MTRSAAADEDPQSGHERMERAQEALPPELREVLFVTFYKSWPAFARSVERDPPA